MDAVNSEGAGTSAACLLSGSSPLTVRSAAFVGTVLFVPGWVVLGGLNLTGSGLAGRGADRLWVIGPALFELLGFATACALLARAIRRRRGADGRQLFGSLIAVRTAGARAQARRCMDDALAHDLRSALFVIDGGARTLVAGCGKLAEADQSTLADIVSRGIDRLKDLVDLLGYEVDEFHVGEIARSVVRGERKRGTHVESVIPAGLEAVGRPSDVAVALQTLMRSPSLRDAPVTVRGCSTAGGVVLAVGPPDLLDDPGVPARSVPDQDGSQAPVSDDALDMYVATRLIEEQGGELRTVAHGDGRVSFEIRLEAAA